MRFPALLAFSLFFTGYASAQTAPQAARDYVYGPRGKLAVTIEPDNYPPSAPGSCTAAMAGPCPIDGINVSWTEAYDIGGGIAGYMGPGGFTTGFSYHDPEVSAGSCYTYSVSAVDNAGHQGPDTQSNTVCPDLCMWPPPDGYFTLLIPGPETATRRVFLDLLSGHQEVEIKLGNAILRRKSILRAALYETSRQLSAAGRKVATFHGGGQ